MSDLRGQGAAVVAVQGLRAGYGGTAVIEGLDFRLRRGEIVVVMGPSGCGKTTLLRSLVGLGGLAPDGAWRWAGGKRPDRIGVVFQEDRLLPWRSVGQNLRVACAALPRAERRRIAEELPALYAAFGLERVECLMPRELSGGMRQRVSLIRALAYGQALQVWDEPFQSLDPALRLGLAAWCRRRFRERGSAALIVSHDPGEACLIADRIVVLDSGARVAEDLSVDLPEGGRTSSGAGWAAAKAGLEARLHGVTSPA